MKTSKTFFFTLAGKVSGHVSEIAPPSHHFPYIPFIIKWLSRVELWVERGCSRVEQGCSGEGGATTSTLKIIFI
jgi:hypothetical protein